MGDIGAALPQGLAACQRKNGQYQAQISEARDELADVDGDLGVDHAGGATAHAALDAPAQCGKQCQPQAEGHTGRRLTAKPGAADHGASNHADADADTDAGAERLPVKDASKNRADCGIERRNGHGKGPRLRERDHIGSRGDGSAEGSRRDDYDAGLRGDATAEVGNLSLFGGKTCCPDGAERVVDTRGNGGQDKHDEQAGGVKRAKPICPNAKELTGGNKRRI